MSHLSKEPMMKDLERRHVKRLNAENQLQGSTALPETFLDNAPGGIYILDMGGNLLYSNRKNKEIIGYKAEELLGMNFLKLDLLPPQSVEKATRLFQAVIEGRPAGGPDEFQLINKDGHLVPVEISTAMVQLAHQSIVVCFVRDISDRRLTQERELREREALKALCGGAPFCVVLIDKKGRLTYINPNFTKLFGYYISDVPDVRTCIRRIYPDRRLRHSVISTWKDGMKGARLGKCELRPTAVTCKDGGQKIVKFLTSILASGDYLITCEDITELRLLKTQLHQAQKMEAIGTLAAGIVHDFNNVLTSLTGYASLMQAKMTKTNPFRPYLDRMLSASRKGAELIESLLAFSRRQPVTLVPLDINNAIKMTEQLLGRLLSNDIKLLISLTQDDTVVMANRSQIDQILFNLIRNATDAMPEGGMLRIETDISVIDSEFIRARGFGVPGRYVVISVSDTGTGMDKKTQEKIFNAFFTTKQMGKGTGLGLATVCGIIKERSGYITVDSELGHGTTFRVYLRPANRKIDQEKDETIPVVQGTEKILIADDNEEVRQFMRKVLQEYGYSSIEARDGEEAVRKFKQHRNIDLVILDSVMPKQNGRQVYEEIRRIESNVRVLVMSGYADNLVLDGGVREGELDFLAKPLSTDTFLAKIREVLDRK